MRPSAKQTNINFTTSHNRITLYIKLCSFSVSNIVFSMLYYAIHTFNYADWNQYINAQ